MKEENIKIAMLEVQNVKRVKAVRLDCSTNSLTVIGGRNGQGKTSVLDAIAFDIGGKRYEPSSLKRDGASGDPFMKVVFSNGMIAERSGKNSALKVTDPNGGKSGQQLLNDFVSQFALDLPKFMHSTDAEKAHTLLDNLGIEAELEALSRSEKKLYEERLTVGRIADQRKKYAAEMPVHEGVPEEPLSISALIKQQQAILAQNGENERLRNGMKGLADRKSQILIVISDLKNRLTEAEAGLATINERIATGSKTVNELRDESTTELETNIRDAEDINNKIRANLDRSKAEMDAEVQQKEYDALTGQIDIIRKQRLDLLNGVELPLPGLSIEDGKLSFNGKFWDCMSGAEQLRVGTAIAQKINPKCGFVLIDKAEQFDTEQLAEFGKWLDAEGLQAICTRVSTGDECSIVIEDGFVQGDEHFITDVEPEPKVEDQPSWKAGEF